MARSTEPFRVEVRCEPGETPARHWVLNCCKCGAEGTMPHRQVRLTQEGGQERLFADRLRRSGWDVGNDLKKPICPSCIEASSKKKVIHMADENVAPIKAEPPSRTPTQMDRQRIYDALYDAYDLKQQSYKVGFTDESVAQRLCVPRAWVTEVRDMMFGPAVPALVAQFMPEINRLDARMSDAEKLIQRAMADLATIKQDKQSLVARVQKAGA